LSKKKRKKKKKKEKRKIETDEGGDVVDGLKKKKKKKEKVVLGVGKPKTEKSENLEFLGEVITPDEVKCFKTTNFFFI
jgi:MoaA/NifB/PqqE/SkfB family radical SAM enzyme